MLPVGSHSLRVGVAGDGTTQKTLSGWLSGTEAGADGITAHPVSPEALREDGSDRVQADCLVIDGDHFGSDSSDVVDEATDEHAEIPVILLFSGENHEMAVDALSAGATETLPRQLVDDPELLCDRIASTTWREHAHTGFRELYDGVAGIVTLHDPDTGAMQHANRALCETLGYERERLLSMDIGDLIADGSGCDHERVREIIAGVPDADSPVEAELPLETADGSVRWVESSLDTATIGGRDVVLSCSVEITERAELEQTYHELFESVADGLVVHDRETGEIRDVNERFCEMNGYTRDELVGASIDTVTPAGDAYSSGAAEDRFQQATHDEPQLFEWRNQRKDGEVVPVEVHLRGARIRGDECILASVREITERKRRERALEEERERYSTLVEQSSDGVAVAKDGEYAFVNDRLAEITGYDREELLGRPIESLFTPEHRDVVRERHQRRVEGESPPTQYDAEVETSDGDQLTLELAVSRIRHEGEPAVMASFRDVTERKRRERAIRALQDATEDMQNAQTAEAVADRAVEATGTVLDLPLSACWLHDDDSRRLEPVAATEAVVERGLFGPLSPGDYEYDAFEQGELTEFSPSELSDQNQLDATLLLPLGEHGLLAAGHQDEVTYDDVVLDVARTLAEHTTTALDRVERAREVRESERRFRLIAEHIDEVIFLTSRDFSEVTYVNPGYEALWDQPVEDLLDDARSFLEAIDPRDRADVEADLGAMVADMERGELADSYEYEFRIRRSGGEVRWIHATGYPVELSGGEGRYVGVVKDVTERKRREQALRESERRLQAILDRIDEAILFARIHELGTELPDLDFVSSGYEDIWGQSLETLHDTYEGGFFGAVHPDDEPEHRAFVDDMLREIDADVAADRYSREYRIERPDGEMRWVHSDYYPVEWDDGPPRIVVVSRDVTDRKRRERRITSFDEATDDLTTADTPEEATQTAVNAATETLGLSAVGAFLYDGDEGVLRPEVVAGPIPDEVVVGPNDGPLWEAFATGTLVASDGGTSMESPADGADDGLTALDSLDEWRGLTLGNHGVLVVGSADSPLDSDTVQAAHVLAATLEAALNHLQGQKQLAAQEEQLQTQTERADRLDRIVRLSRQVEAAITEASDPSEIERAVCERLASSGPYEATWIGGVDVGTDRITARAIVGTSAQYVDSLDLTTAETATDAHPAVRTWQTDTVQVVDSLVSDGPTGAWRQQALSEGHQSLCAVPLTYDGITYGVLTIAADSPNVYDERIQDVLSQLGTSVGHALAAIERRRALESDETIELEFSGDGVDLPFARAARRADCRVQHERTVARQDGTVSVYFGFEGDTSGDAAAVASRTLPGEVDVVTEDSSSVLVEARTDLWFGSLLAEYGAVLRRAVTESGETTLVVEVPTQADVRSFTERLQELAPSLELVAKRQHQRQDRTPEEISAQITDELTDRQLEVLQTALSAGYFEWPRENDGSEVADRLGITQPTLNKHLRLAERKTFELLFHVDG